MSRLLRKKRDKITKTGSIRTGWREQATHIAWLFYLSSILVSYIFPISSELFIFGSKMKRKMKSALKKHMMYIVPAICVGIILTIDSGKENIAKLMNEALKEAITIDFHRRINKEIKAMGKPIGRKIIKMKITGEKGSGIIEFKDSIEEYLAKQLAAQYILAQIHPVVPNDLNTIFNEELKRRGVSCPTGIIYQHNDRTKYSGQDSITLKKAIITPPVVLDIKNTVKVQAWADCDRMTLIRHTNKKNLGYVIFSFIASAFVLFYKGKKKDTETILSPSPGIRIDENEHKIYIDSKECVTTKAQFLILALLVREPGCFVTREQIAQTLWPKESETVDTILLNNRIDGHINGLRKTLHEFPEYKLVTVKGKGYHLSYPAV